MRRVSGFLVCAFVSISALALGVVGTAAATLDSLVIPESVRR